MTIIWAALALAVIFAIAAAVIGTEARRLATKLPERTYNSEEALAWVCERLEAEVTAQLSYDDVRSILGWHLEFFRVKGVSSNGSGPHVEGPVVVSAAETIAFVMGQAERAGTEVTPAQVGAVLEAQMAFLMTIGAVDPVAEPEDRTPQD
ncbi:MAG: hypothetical protein ACT4OS_02430 [Acidimicrobiales bacterium]